MHATPPDINVEFIHLHLNGLLFLDLFLMLMDPTFHCGMLTTTITHRSLISHLSEDGHLLGLNSMQGMLLYAQWVLIKIMLLMLEIFKNIQSIKLNQILLFNFA